LDRLNRGPFRPARQVIAPTTGDACHSTLIRRIATKRQAYKPKLRRKLTIPATFRDLWCFDLANGALRVRISRLFTRVPNSTLEANVKRTVLTVVATLAFAALAMHALGLKIQPANDAMVIAAPAPAAVPLPAACPNIHSAQDALGQAEEELRTARHDFCGHKADAMQAVHHAREELRQAENCQRCR
jgi:hypothetical protein